MTEARKSNGRLPWPYDLLLLAVLAVPAFSGYPLANLPAQIVAGVRWSWVFYFAAIHLAAGLVLGRRLYANIVALAALITLPVVYAGAAISWVGFQLGLSGTGPAAAGSHYLQLCLTMLTVVPLALAMVSVVPFHRIEQSLLLRLDGVTATQKKILMAMRVFNHIAFFVLPGTLEVLREERPMARWRRQWASGKVARFSLLGRLPGHLVLLSAEIISASLQYVPLWAHEIARLPERRNGRTK
ncbi:MAG: hypothetical protein P8X55_02235 [Desulfosarcinaceae bacterium]